MVGLFSICIRKQLDETYGTTRRSSVIASVTIIIIIIITSFVSIVGITITTKILCTWICFRNRP